MKKLLFPLLILLLLVSCSEEPKKLEVFSTEAFAFYVGSGWELNASARIKGFEQEEQNGEHIAKLSYYADLVNPDGKILEEVDYGMIDKSSKEEITDLPLELQIVLDSTFVTGKYKINFHVIDDLSEQEAAAQAEFELSAE